MPPVTRIGDNNTGHDACPPVPLDTGSPNVFANKIPVGRIGDIYVSHGCFIHSPHNDVIAAGSSAVFANKINLARIGDSVSLGGAVAVGSPNVMAGG